MDCVNCGHDARKHIRNGDLVTCCHVERGVERVRSWSGEVRHIAAMVNQCPCRAYSTGNDYEREQPTPYTPIDTASTNQSGSAYTLDSINSLRAGIYPPYQQQWAPPPGALGPQGEMVSGTPPPKPEPEPAPHDWPVNRKLDL